MKKRLFGMGFSFGIFREYYNILDNKFEIYQTYS